MLQFTFQEDSNNKRKIKKRFILILNVFRWKFKDFLRLPRRDLVKAKAQKLLTFDEMSKVRLTMSRRSKI
jgi:hypothetical protein